MQILDLPMRNGTAFPHYWTGGLSIHSVCYTPTLSSTHGGFICSMRASGISAGALIMFAHHDILRIASQILLFSMITTDRITVRLAQLFRRFRKSVFNAAPVDRIEKRIDVIGAL